MAENDHPRRRGGSGIGAAVAVIAGYVLGRATAPETVRYLVLSPIEDAASEKKGEGVVNLLSGGDIFGE